MKTKSHAELEDRVKRLEDLYDPMYHKMDMLERYIEKLVDFLPKHLSATTKFANDTDGRVRLLTKFIRDYLSEKKDDGYLVNR